MNAHNMARTAYDPVSTPLRTPRSTEYEAFSRITRKLKEVHSKNCNVDSNFLRVLHENQLLWSFFAASVADGNNALPKDLRAKLFYLYEFTTHHSRKIRKGEGSLVPLIEVNIAVMTGLKTSGEGK